VGLHRVRWASLVPAAAAVAGCAADLVAPTPWIGEVKPDSAWLTRQGVAGSYPVRFTIDEAGRAMGTIQFAGGANPAAGETGALTGQLEGDALTLSATVEGGPAVAVALRPDVQVNVSLTGYIAADGSVEGVGVLDMGDLACVTGPASASSTTRCPRRLVPIRWTARQ
jgi:hypothetical protein